MEKKLHILQKVTSATDPVTAGPIFVLGFPGVRMSYTEWSYMSLHVYPDAKTQVLLPKQDYSCIYYFYSYTFLKKHRLSNYCIQQTDML